jgi:hypothetical protein
MDRHAPQSVSAIDAQAPAARSELIMRLNTRHALVPLILATLVIVPGRGDAYAQLTEASLRGKIIDATGQGVPAASLIARHEATGQERSELTDLQGTFLLPGLQPGEYRITATSPGFRAVERAGLRLTVGATVDVTIRLDVIELAETVAVTAPNLRVAASTEARITDTFGRAEITELPMPQRDIYLLPKLSAGAAFIPGAANSTKLSSSPIITVNGNRYRGNNYVLDGSMNTNPNNTGEPAIVPSLESVEEVQVQTLNFASEFGRGNGSVINIRTKSGSNDLKGVAWEYFRDDALNARNYFASITPPQTFNQFGANAGGPIWRNKTFFFGSYEGTRNDISRPYAFQVETPEFRDYVFRTAPGSVAARLLQRFPTPTPPPGLNGDRYVDQQMMATPNGPIPAIGRANVLIADHIGFDQFLGRLDHGLTNRDRIVARWIGERQHDQGGTSSAQATLGRALRGSRGPFTGFFANLNVGYTRILSHAFNDLHVSQQIIDTSRGRDDATVPTITITGITAPFGDVFRDTSRLGTVEMRDILTLDRGAHAIRMGVDVRRITKGLALGPPQTGSFLFSSIADFAADRPFRQTLTVDPQTGEPTDFPRHFTQYETGAFVQDQWTVNSRLSVGLGLRHDYFGTVSERDGLLSSIRLGPGDTFNDQLASASIGRVDRLYDPQRLNFSPRVGFAFDPSGNGRTSIRTGFSMAYQPHHGQSISGARALPPDALQGVIQPSNGIGTHILYDVSVPYNPEFARGLNASGGVQSRPGEAPIRITGFVVNPTIKTQYTESWFVNTQRRIGERWMMELGYVGTKGINLERIDDVNRFAGDLLDGREDRINPNFSTILFVTDGVTSTYNAVTAELRREFVGGFSLQANYRFSRWYDTSSDTSTGQFQDNAEPGKGAVDIACLECERGPSLFDIPHRLSISTIWSPRLMSGRNDVVGRLAHGWQLAGVLTAQSGRPFSVWNGASFAAGGDYNADGGGGAVGGGFYDRPNAPAPGSYPSHFTQDDFLNGLFDPAIFTKPASGTNGTLGRNTFRGPRYISLDLTLSRNVQLTRGRQLQLRVDAYNALNNLNLFLPNSDLSLSNFGRSTQAFDARTVQLGVRVAF